MIYGVKKKEGLDMKYQARLSAFFPEGLLKRRSDRNRMPSSFRADAGFTIIEIIIVIALIGTILSILITQLTSTQDQAMRDAARLAMGKIQQSLQLYRVHNHKYPGTDQGLEALVSNASGSATWRGPYIEAEKLKDPWNNLMQYETDQKTIKISSAGPDGEFGTEDDVIYPEPKAETEN